MNESTPVTGKALIDYTQDTLFGTLAKHAECQVCLTQDQPGRLVLQVFPPLPDDMQDAQTLVFALEGRRTSGVIRERERLADRSLRLEVEL